MAFETQSNRNMQQTADVGARQKEKQREQEQSREAQRGPVTGNFRFEVQKESVEQLLQRPRSQEYLAAMDMIDFLSADDEEIMERLKENIGEEFIEELQEMTDEEIFEMMTQAFHDEFAELETNLDNELVAVLAPCYIDGCDCHAIDQYGHILEHYNKDAGLPEDLERGRMIFRSKAGNCQCVEVYKTCCRVISRSGDVEVIKK